MKAIATTLVIGLATCAGSAMASDGTITVTGTVTTQTCNINSPSGNNLSVPLPPVSANALSGAGATAGSTPFQLSLTSCTGTTAQTHFDMGSTIDTATGNLVNTAATGAAGKVQVQILNNVGQAINLSTNANSQVVTLSSGSGTLNYYAQYYSMGGTTPGAVSTSVLYTMIYN